MARYMCFDGFARHCQLLDHKLPAITRVPVCQQNAFRNEVRTELDSWVYLLITCSTHISQSLTRCMRVILQKIHVSTSYIRLRS